VERAIHQSIYCIQIFAVAILLTWLLTTSWQSFYNEGSPIYIL